MTIYVSGGYMTVHVCVWRLHDCTCVSGGYTTVHMCGGYMTVHV